MVNGQITGAMKRIFILIISLLTLMSARAQKCDNIKQGKFRMSDAENPEYLITRTANHQIEENKTTGLKMQFDVKWTSDCNYELSKPKVLKGEAPFPVSDNHVLYVKVTKVTSTYYTTEVTANFSDFKVDFKIQILE